MKLKAIIIFIVLLGSSNLLLCNYSLLVANTDSKEGDFQPYCGYSLIYPILSNWNNYK